MNRPLAFFGAFNPPTVAHVELARFAMEKTGRDGVIFVPSRSVYIEGEQGKDFAFDDRARLAMLTRIAQARPWMAVSGWELDQPRQPRTYETLCHLRDTGLSPVLLLGSDKLPELEHGWLHVEAIAEEFGIVCLTRGADACEALIRDDPYLRALSPHIQVLETPEALRAVSSTAVRQRLAAIDQLRGEVRELMPKEIWEMVL